MIDHFLTRFFWFMGQDLGFLQAGGLLAVTLLLIGNLAASIVVSHPFEQQKLKPWYYLMFLPLIFYPLSAAVAVLAENPGGGSPHQVPPQQWAMWSLNAFSVVSIVLGLFFIIRLKRLRWFSVSVFLCLQWLLQTMLLVASMGVTGLWM